MRSWIKQVFSIIGVLVLSLILWGIVFGAIGRTFMWGAIEPSMQKQWSDSTMRDGADLAQVFRSVFDAAPSYVEK